MEKKQSSIGVFDSGVGGISVLPEIRRLLPTQRILYFGDDFNAPYGTKSPDDVLRLSIQVMDKLVAFGCKAVVIACNTITSVAAQELRRAYPLPIVGMEPALKPAALLPERGKILVMATPVTLSQEKFARLMEHYGQDAIPVPGAGLPELVERGEMESEAAETLLRQLLLPHLQSETHVKAIVLGCTHYVFLKNAIRRVAPDVPLIDGNEGTARQLKRRLEETGLLNTLSEGDITFHSSDSSAECARRMQQLYEYAAAQSQREHFSAANRA